MKFKSQIDPVREVGVPSVISVLASLVAYAITQKPIVSLLSVACFAVMYVACLQVYPKIRKIVILDRCGIINVFPNQKEAEQSIMRRIPFTEKVDILTVRGLGVIGLKDSLLKQHLIDNPGKIELRVLFLNPDSSFVEVRAGEVKEDPAAFRQGILLCQEYLTELKSNCNVKVEAHMYDALPTWRLMFLDDVLYVSSFGHTCDGHHSSMYEIRADANFLLYETFRRYFAYLWSVSPIYLQDQMLG